MDNGRRGSELMADDKVSLCLDAEGWIRIDIRCQECNYNLRGIGPNQVCPECGARVRDTLRPDLLMFLGPRVLRRLRAGTRYVVFGVLGQFLVEVAYVIFAMLDPGVFAGNWLEWVRLTCSLTTYALIGFGFLSITSGAVVMRRPESALSARRIVGWGFILSLLIWGLADAVMAFGRHIGWPSSSMVAILVNYAPIPGILLQALPLWALGIYGADLVGRLPDPRRARRVRQVMTVWAVAIFLSGVTSTIQLISLDLAEGIVDYQDLSSSWVFVGTQVLNAILVLVVLICFLRGTVLLIWFGRALKPVRQLATEILGEED